MIRTPGYASIRTIIVGLITFLAWTQAAGQEVDIRGVIVDSTSGEKIPFASVALRPTSRGTVSNANGFYLLTKIPRGRYEIVIAAIGYAEKKRTLIVQGFEPLTLNFQLVSKPVEVSEVLVIGKRHQEVMEVNTSVHVMSPQDLQKVPVGIQDDLFRAMEILPGIVSTADVSSKFYVRGGAGDQNLILLDGMKIYNAYHAFGMFSIFDPDIMKSMEVYTGAFPAGYGGRLSSVLNVSTRDGNSSRMAGSANLNFISSKVQLEGPVGDDNSWIFSGRKSLFNESYKYFLSDPVPVSFYDAFLKVTLAKSAIGHSTFHAFISHDEMVSSKQDEADHYWNTQSFSYTITELIENRLYVDANVYSTKFSLRRGAKQSPFVRPAESIVTEGGLHTDVTVYTESQDLYKLGFEVNIPQFDNTLTSSSNITRQISTTNIEAWLWIRYQATFDRLKTDVGVHGDMVNFIRRGPSFGSIQPRINVSYRLHDDWWVKGSYGIFSQNMITVGNEDDIISLFEAWIYLPNNLPPEVAHHFVFGVDGNVSSEISVSVQAYYKIYSSLAVYNREKVFPYDPDYHKGEGTSQGVETLLRYGSADLDLFAAYTLGWTSLTVDGLTYPPRYDRRHTVNLLAVIKPIEKFDVSFRWEFGSGYPYSQTIGYYDRLLLGDIGRSLSVDETGKPYSIIGEKNAARLPAYHRLDGSLSYHLSLSSVRVTLGASIMNVYDNKNILYFDRKTGQRVNMVSLFPSATLKVEF